MESPETSSHMGDQMIFDKQDHFVGKEQFLQQNGTKETGYPHAKEWIQTQVPIL